ncbi:MAG TPA: M1 family metallopeptidase [Candidatus Saccharimonadales bacterium]|nr:M1 family metallopeptidase [Candidatus Saccharimonadales bacterium]
MSRVDPHSYYDTDHPRTKSLALNLAVDFDRKVIAGTVTLRLDREGGGVMDLDTKGLTISAVRSGEKDPVRFELGDEEPILGRRLRLHLPGGAREVSIDYETSPDAVALQWLAPAQTEGGRHPFLFSQCQAIHARTVVPLQDSPRVRVSYSAEVTVPEALAAVMSAGPAGTRPGPAAGTKTYLFEMPQPIPPYLLALAVGDLQSRDLSPRSRVWAEPATADKAAWEFAQIEEMIVKAEGLFGKYEWDRYDMLVLPPSFPYGGMENPRMTFLTPTLLAGDRSLVDVVAHELAHSWTGNLVTNATMDHFWLNEGSTVYAERRILEAMHGKDAAVLSWAIGQKALDKEFERFGPGSPLTRLRTELEGIDPDDAFSAVPYEKGSRFLSLIESTAGRETFDAFLREYMARFRFTSITSEEFIGFLEEKLPGIPAKVRADEWLYEAGIPSNAPVFRSGRLEELTSLAEKWSGGTRPTKEQSGGWSPTEMLIYLQHLPREIDHDGCRWLDANLGLTARGNYEILVEWLTIAAGSDYEPVFGRVKEVLTRVGRMKYLRPLYDALGGHDRTRALAREIFAQAGPGYHGVARRMVEGLIGKYPQGGSR